MWRDAPESMSSISTREFPDLARDAELKVVV